MSCPNRNGKQTDNYIRKAFIQMNKQKMIEAREDYIGFIKKELLGSGSEVSIPDAQHEIISNSPERHYSLGILFPKDSKIKADNDELQIEDKNKADDIDELKTDGEEDVDCVISSTDSEIKEDMSFDEDPLDEETLDEETLDEEIGLSAQNMPSSAGITFFADGNTEIVVCNISFSTYKKVKPEECRIPFFPETPDVYKVPEELSTYVFFDKIEGCLKFSEKGFSKKR